MCNLFISLHSYTLLIRFSGTIVGVEDISPHWVNSKWRSLKVWSSFTLQLFLLFLVIKRLSFFHILSIFRFNGMNHRLFCVLIEFLHGNWSHLCLTLLQTPSHPKETRDRGLPFYLQQCLILLCKVAWAYLISL